MRQASTGCNRIPDVNLILNIVAYWSLDDGGELAIAHDPLSEAKMLNSISTARCFENGIVFVLCNPAHESDVERKQPFGTMAGRTQITVPFKGPVAHCDHIREEMIIADVDIKTITDDVEEVYKIRKDWDEGLVYGGGGISQSKI